MNQPLNQPAINPRNTDLAKQPGVVAAEIDAADVVPAGACE
jgi:hypothetical protein